MNRRVDKVIEGVVHDYGEALEALGGERPHSARWREAPQASAREALQEFPDVIRHKNVGWLADQKVTMYEPTRDTIFAWSGSGHAWHEYSQQVVDHELILVEVQIWHAGDQSRRDATRSEVEWHMRSVKAGREHDASAP